MVYNESMRLKDWLESLQQRFKRLRPLLPTLGEQLIVIAVSAYMIWAVGLSVRRNYATNLEILALEAELASLKQQASYYRYLIEYYKTATFKELKAREQLGYSQPGEKVVSVPVQPEDLPDHLRRQLEAEAAAKSPVLSNPAQWRNYFWGS
ncbi:MAG: hypothetical protein CEO22_80 [Candidatus Berkelbacteria bacterium Gr01-1014_85]|uniref:Septum formation initiator n=1 Tax=Candidatus Berkelbacteria bacterium Gr01-1014_85 TaxID=2017150 RepID=A0A554JDS9_9BACT|nr:MAG: hypothetical protein CEO22_80 [Candidatus Berkelbacteria bacterium Gr01-1014_85]